MLFSAQKQGSAVFAQNLVHLDSTREGALLRWNLMSVRSIGVDGRCRLAGFLRRVGFFVRRTFGASEQHTPDYRENERFYDKNPSIEDTDNRAKILIEKIPSWGFHRIRVVRGEKSCDGFCTFVRFHPTLRGSLGFFE